MERYSHTGRAVGELQRTPLETLVEEPNRVANRYEDCSAEYRTDGAEHFYSVTALDNNPGPDEEGAFGTAYTSMLRYGTSREPEGPLNVRLTHDTQSSRWLAWDAPRDPWLTTVKTARAGSGPQQVVTDPWTTGYRVERREYRRTEGGGWFLPEVEDEPIWSATMTVGSSTTGTGSTGYFGLGSNAYGVMTQTSFTHPVGSGSWEVTGLFVLAGELRLNIQEGAPLTDNFHTDAFEDWVLVVDGRSFPFELPEGVVGGNLQVSWPNHGLNWIDGQQLSLALVERLDWEALRDETDGDTDTSFTDSEDKGDKQYVYRVWAYNPRGLSLHSWRGDWVFNGGDPGGDPEPAVYIPPSPGLQQGGETPSNTPATGAPAIGGAARVGETLTAGTAGIADEDGLTKVSYTYQWTAGGSDIDGATNSTYTLSDDDEGKAIRVRVSFIDDAGNQESLTSVATVAVAAAPNREATGQPAISGTPQVGQTLTAGTAGISDEDGLENVSYRYQWIAGGSDIDGATGSTYALTASEQGQTIQVRVSFTDDADNQESLTSVATVPVAAAPNREATGQPAISGTPQVGQTLTAGTSGIADEDGLENVSYSYQWIAGGSDIDGATGSSYALTSSEQGQTVQVRVTFTDDADNAESLISEATETVAAKPNSEPTGLPTISGTPQVDETLTADTSGIADADGLTNVSYSYQWIAGGSNIDGATGSSYLLTSSDQGQTIQVKVNFTDDADNQESLTSAETLAVAAKPNTAATGEPTISGTPQVEQTLTADTSAISDGDGLSNVSYQYQWLRDGADIAGQTNSTYRLVSADQDKTIKVRVTFRDDADNAESLTSAATTAVAARPTPAVLLTASFANMPADHNGENFTFQLTFSENVNAGYARIRDHALTVTGGSIASASRITLGSNQGWTVEVDPTGNGSVRITLPETTDCDASGAICTDDGRKLSHPTSATVTGPPAISVSDAAAQEAEEAVLVFTVTLSHASSRTVTVDYATSDGTAQAGSDYTAASATLTFNAGETSQTVQVTVLTDSDDEGQETLTLTLSNPSQATLDDATGTGTIENGESSSGTQEDPPAETPVVLLTASFANVPATHNGSAFTFDLSFSENVKAGYARIRDDAFTIMGGEIDKAVRKTQGSNQSWIITVQPDGNGAITITLPPTTDCDDTGAICDYDGDMLSDSTSAQVAGPE